MSSTTASVLLVSRGFPPYAASLGGAVRILKLAEYLRDRGAEVHVLAGKGRLYGDFGYGDLLRSISVHYVPDPLLARSGPAVPGQTGPAQTGWRGMARSLIVQGSVPDTGIFAYPRLKRVARELIVQRGIRNIVTSGPPHSDHLIGLAAKREFGAAINWIVDYRDSWNGTALFRKSNGLLQYFNRAIEKTVLRRADHITYISEPMIEKIAAMFGPDGEAARGKSTLVMNGYDARQAPVGVNWVARGSRLRLGYFGLIDDRPDSYRNPTDLFEAIIANDLDVSIELYGQIRIAPQWQERLGDRLTIGGVLPHAESVMRMASMDALLVLHTRHDGADEVLTGKIFEYLLSGRPVLSVGPEQMAANGLLRQLLTGHSVRHDDSGALVEKLRELVRLKAEGRLASTQPAGIERYSREYQYSRIEKLLSLSRHPKS
jgi:glycosyltransferase involved in cell wall biosynthesis